ncbi:hypothetical protein [Absidia glauca]|uniref:Uncharacterized protein n=1 Tax=Absidia glauca TaxID=4829 RepID=A0A168SH55_ABSGL|nr:hypothetical protein [Absidia glauca]
MPLFTKLHSIRSSVHIPFASKQSAPTPPSPRSYTDQPSPQSRPSSLARHPQQPQQPSLQRQRTISTPTASFAETLKVMSKQVQQQNQFDDAFASFFFTEKRCRNRAIFMAARLAQSLGPDFAQLHQPTSTTTTTTTTTIHSFWKRVMDRFYTLNYLLYVVPSTEVSRKRYLAALGQRMTDGIGARLKDRRGGLETYFALCYATTHDDKAEDARRILEHCLDSEDKLGHSERDAMYIFHGLRAGFLDGHYEPEVVLDDDDALLATLRHAVLDNKRLMEQSYVNPFEDDACIVDSDDDYPDGELVKSRHSDSGFYEEVV